MAKSFVPEKPDRKILLMRHGAAGNQLRDVLSCYPEKFHNPLTSEGKRVVEASAKELKDEGIDMIFSSDLLRARQTAQIVHQKTGAPVRLDQRLREHNGGIFNGQHDSKFWGWLEARHDIYRTRLPQGESLQSFYNRALAFIREIMTDRRYQDKTILVVSHGFILATIEGIIGGKTLQEIVATKRFQPEKAIKPGYFRQLKF